MATRTAKIGRGMQQGAVVALLVLGAFGCSKKSTTLVAANRPATAAVETEKDGTPIQHGTRRKLNLDVPVIVDGKEVAVLRYGELPSTVVARPSPTGDTEEKRYYRFVDYLEAVGVPVAQVQSIHLAGNRDYITSVDGDELRAHPERFVFDFLQKTTGIAHLGFETTGLRNGLRIDEIRNVNVFVKQSPWAIDKKHHCYLDASDGSCKPAATFIEGDLAKGTRVYVDGKMAGFVKRRLVGEGAIVAKKDDGAVDYSLDKFIAQLGVDTKTVRRIDLLVGDSVVASADKDAWSKAAGQVIFSLARHTHGKVTTVVPASLQAKGTETKDRAVQVTAVRIFRATAAPAVVVESLDEVEPEASPGEAAAAPEGAALETNGVHERDLE